MKNLENIVNIEIKILLALSEKISTSCARNEQKHQALLVKDVEAIFPDWFVPGLRIQKDMLRLFVSLCTFDVSKAISANSVQYLDCHQRFFELGAEQTDNLFGLTSQQFAEKIENAVIKGVKMVLPAKNTLAEKLTVCCDKEYQTHVGTQLCNICYIETREVEFVTGCKKDEMSDSCKACHDCFQEQVLAQFDKLVF